MTRIMGRLNCATVGVVLSLGLGATSEGALLLNLTDSHHLSGADAGAEISPGQQVGDISGSTWNQINSGFVSSIVDSSGDTLSGVTVDVGAALAGATTIDYGVDPRFHDLGGSFSSGVFAGNAQSGIFNNVTNGNEKVGVRVSGLAAGTYTVYVTALNTNSTAINNYDIFAGAVDSASGNTDYTGFASARLDFYATDAKPTDQWVEHVNYVAMTVTIGDTQDLVIVSDGVHAGQDRGFLNTIEVVVPEPASLALLGVGGLLASRRPLMPRRGRA